jgi:c-di-GMP-binding flagellar brake protein YcgR
MQERERSYGPVERRKDPRIEINQEVTVTLLGEPDSTPFPAVAIDVSGSGMRILSQRPVPYQAMVKVEVRDLLLLGEVIRVQVCDRGNVVALKFWHSLDPSTIQQLAPPTIE